MYGVLCRTYLRFFQRGSNPGFSAVEGQSPALVVAAACDKWDAVQCMVRESRYQPLPLARLLVSLLFIVGITPDTIGQFIRVKSRSDFWCSNT